MLDPGAAGSLTSGCAEDSAGFDVASGGGAVSAAVAGLGNCGAAAFPESGDLFAGEDCAGEACAGALPEPAFAGDFSATVGPLLKTAIAASRPPNRATPAATAAGKAQPRCADFFDLRLVKEETGAYWP